MYNTVPDIAADTPYTYSSIAFMCVTEPGAVRITSVRLRDAFGDIVVRQWAIDFTSPDGTGVGGMRGTMASIAPEADPSKPQVVDTPCPGLDEEWTGGGCRVVLEVARLSGESAGARALVIEYESNEQKDLLTIPIGVSLCAKECPEPDLWPPLE